MALLNKCNQCGKASESEDRQNNTAHRAHQLSIAESFAYIRRTRRVDKTREELDQEAEDESLRWAAEGEETTSRGRW